MIGQSQRMALLVLVAALVGGVAGGVALDRTVLLPHRIMVGRTERGPRPTSRELRRRFSERMARDLGLTDGQRARMDTILARQFAAMDSVNRLMRPHYDVIWRGSRAQIDSVLDPAQRATLAALRAARRRGDGGERGERTGERSRRGDDAIRP